jgi:hypothetical protein
MRSAHYCRGREKVRERMYVIDLLTCDDGEMLPLILLTLTPWLLRPYRMDELRSRH